MAEYKYSDKRFLSLHPQQNSTVGWYVDVDEEDDFVDSNIRLTDCNKVINIEMYWSNPEGFERRIKKLDHLIDSLHFFKQEMYAAEAIRSVNLLVKEAKDERKNSKDVEEDSKD